MTAAFAQGLALGGSLIVAIGAQNAFVLRQGLARRQVALVATICFLCDAGLIALGALGLGEVIAGSAVLRRATAWGGTTDGTRRARVSGSSASRPSTARACSPG